MSITRDEAIARVGLDAVEAVESENCEPTNRVGYNGVRQGDAETEWAASVNCYEDGFEVRLYAYYYTTNEQDAAMEAADGDGSAIDWVIEFYDIR